MAESPAIAEKVELKIPTTLKALIEALVFAAKEPLSIAQLKAIYQGDNRIIDSRQIEIEVIRQAISDLNKEYEKADRPYRIIGIAGGYQFATLSDYAEWLGRLHKEQARRKLSQSGVETLAIIAYKQPITKSEIEKIRGVNCDYVLKTLLEKELITVTGRAESVGRPLLYGTTKEFLKHFGLQDVTDLPRPREIEEILGESQFETERRMLEAQTGAESMKKEEDDFKSRLPHIPKKKSELEQKEATIYSKTHSREIKIVPAEDESKLSDQTAQEVIQFSPDSSQRVEGQVKVQEKDQSVSQHSEENKIDTQEIIAVPSASSGISSDKIIETEISPKEVIVSQVDDHGVPKSKWMIWKEKIQGFIKKLFA